MHPPPESTRNSQRFESLVLLDPTHSSSIRPPLFSSCLSCRYLPAPCLPQAMEDANRTLFLENILSVSSRLRLRLSGTARTGHLPGSSVRFLPINREIEPEVCPIKGGSKGRRTGRGTQKTNRRTAMASRAGSPWDDVEDLEGDVHYRVLGLERKASADDVKKAYRTKARELHPDKGGDPVAFGKVQEAYEVLSDPKKRETYDAWAKDLKFRYVRGVAPRAEGGEGILLDEFERMGISCDPLTQLVITCEVCRRPSTKECWTCGMKICDFCGLKRHWKGSVGLHWPLVNSDHMRERLAKRQFEEKKLEDARRLALEDPNYRNEAELQDIRKFKDAAVKMQENPRRKVTFDMELGRFYMWAQTEAYVYLAVYIPTGYSDKEIILEADERAILIQAEESPPVIDRFLSRGLSLEEPIESFVTDDNRFFTAALPKGKMGERWDTLFEGDPNGVRCLEPPYRLKEHKNEVVMEIVLPFWIDEEDVRLDISEEGFECEVRNTIHLKRSFWKNKSKKGSYQAVDLQECAWSLDEEVSGKGETCKVLMVNFVRPPPTQDEIMYKKGNRDDNQTKPRRDGHQRKGVRFFIEDEDEFGLEDVLQALCFLDSSETYVPPKPWIKDAEPKVIREFALLSPRVKELVEKMLGESEDESEPGDEFYFKSHEAPPTVY